MVSYPEDPSHSSSTVHTTYRSSQRSSSVASSSRASSHTTVRRHRHGRSHAGGSVAGSAASSAPAIKNEFPIFALTGDVEIVIRAPPLPLGGGGGAGDRGSRREQRYLLHRLYLAQCSGFFEAGMSEVWSPAGSAVGTDGGRSASLDGRGGGRRWRYELDWGKDEGEMPMLVQKQLTSSSLFGAEDRPPPIQPRPPPPTNGFFRRFSNFSTANVSAPGPADPTDEIFRTYDNLFRIFYNFSPSLDSVNIANAYVECKSLLQAADMYDALEVVGSRVDHHLQRFQQRLWKQIAKYPPSYLKLGYLARSPEIFAEAMIHVVGQWPLGLQQLRNQLPQSVIDLIEDKVDELDEVKARVEAKLWRLTLTTSRGERVSPHNNHLDWLIMSLWRQWFADSTTPSPAGILKDSTNSASRRPGSSSRNSAPGTSKPSLPPSLSLGRVYRQIGDGGPAYLDRDELKRLLKSAGADMYSRENLRRAERRMDELKNLARDAVRPLLRCFLQLDPREVAGLGHLCCVRLEGGEMPWEG